MYIYSMIEPILSLTGFPFFQPETIGHILKALMIPCQWIHAKVKVFFKQKLAKYNLIKQISHMMLYGRLNSVKIAVNN